MFSLEETGRQIGEKLFALLNKEQRKELIHFIKEIDCTYLEDAEAKQTATIINNSLMSEYFKQHFTERQIGDLYFCLEQRTVKIRERIIKLTAKEFDLLALLIMHPKRVFTYEMLMELIWHDDYTFYSRKAVNNHVSNLRKKLKIAPDLPDYIKSVYGVGYKFEG